MPIFKTVVNRSTLIVTANSKSEAIGKFRRTYGFTPQYVEELKGLRYNSRHKYYTKIHEEALGGTDCR